MKTTEFKVHGHYTVSNCGGYEIELSPDGEFARVRDAYGSDSPTISDWLYIDYIVDFMGETVPTIDPNGYNIPLDQVMKVR